VSALIGGMLPRSTLSPQRTRRKSGGNLLKKFPLFFL
jgi:hypothetical protein